MRRFAIRCLSVITILMVLTGCITQQVETSLNEDGSGTNVMRFGLSSEALGFLDSMGSEAGGGNPLDEMGNEMSDLPAEWNAQLTDWSTEEWSGKEVRMDFDSLAMLQMQLDQIATSDATDSGLFQNPKVEDQGENYAFSMNVDTSAMNDTSNEFGGAELFKDALIYWEVTMPGEISSFEPKEIAVVQEDGRTVRFTFPLDTPGNYAVNVVGSKSGSSGGISSMLAWVLGGVGGLVVLAGLGMLLMNRNKTTPVASAVGGGGYDQGSWGQTPVADNSQQPYPSTPETYEPMSYAPPSDAPNPPEDSLPTEKL